MKFPFSPLFSTVPLEDLLKFCFLVSSPLCCSSLYIFKFWCDSEQIQETRTSLIQLIILFIMQARNTIGILDTWAHWWLMFIQLSTKIPRSFSDRQVAFQLHFSCLYQLHAGVLTQVQVWALNLVEWHVAGCAHQFCLSIFLCRTFLPSHRSTVLSNLVLSVNLLGVYSTSSSRSVTKMLNKIHPSTKSWVIPLFTGCQLDWTQFTVTLWAQLSIPIDCSSQWTVHLSKLLADSFSKRI